MRTTLIDRMLSHQSGVMLNNPSLGEVNKAELGAVSQLDIVQVVHLNRVINLSAADVIAFTQGAGSGLWNLDANSSVTFADSANRQTIRSLSATHTLSISQGADASGGQWGGGGAEPVHAIFDSDAQKGDLVYVSGNGHVDLAVGTGFPQSHAIGVAAQDVTAGQSGDVITGGPFTSENWSLTPGTVYFLSATTPGALTATAPNSIGNHVIILGAATTDAQLNLEIHWALVIGS